MDAGGVIISSSGVNSNTSAAIVIVENNSMGTGLQPLKPQLLITLPL